MKLQLRGGIDRVFSGITNDDASLPGSHSVTEESRRRGEWQRHETEGERKEADTGEAGGRRRGWGGSKQTEETAVW